MTHHDAGSLLCGTASKELEGSHADGRHEVGDFATGLVRQDFPILHIATELELACNGGADCEMSLLFEGPLEAHSSEREFGVEVRFAGDFHCIGGKGGHLPGVASLDTAGFDDTEVASGVFDGDGALAGNAFEVCLFRGGPLGDERSRRGCNYAG